jgi:hypothetical protein
MNLARFEGIGNEFPHRGRPPPDVCNRASVTDNARRGLRSG